MKQAISDRMTVHIQAWSSFLLMLGLAFGAYKYGFVPHYGGLLDHVMLVPVTLVSSFLALSIVGMVMWTLNLLFFWVQVYRHGSPVAQLDE